MSMTTEAVQGSFSEGLANAGEAIKEGAIWFGRAIEEGCIWLADAIKSAWEIASPHLKDAAMKTLEFCKTPAGFSVMGGVVGIVLGVSAEAVEHKSIAIALRIAAAAGFVGAGIAIGVGITNGFLIPVV